ncbi:MAG: trimeric autotransporter adhesin [Gaiellales bacterium]|nr:trimeric autotransporter adhesin [Gaiellales bacterium]
MSASVTPGSLSFGNQKVGTSSASQDVTITNDTGSEVVLTGPAVTSPSDYTVGGNCGNSLVADESCTATVTFHPAAAGSRPDSLAFSFDGTPQDPVTLTGTGTEPAVNFPDGASVTFAAAVGAVDPKVITLKNNGEAPLVISGTSLPGTDAAFTKPSADDNCAGTTVAPSDFCTVTIRFSPTANGSHSGTLRFTDDATGSPHDVTLTGSVLLPGIDSNPTNVDFSDFTHGQRSPARTVTITNTGGANLHLGLVQIAGANVKSFFLGTTNCKNATLAPNETCTVNVRFVPKRAEPRGADLIVQNDAGADKHVALAGTGVPPDDVTGFKSASGCSDVAISWVRPTDSHLRGIVVVRNKSRTPRGPKDGTPVRHGKTGAVDTAPKTFTTYHYAVFAAYTTWDGAGKVYAKGVDARIRTGRVCRPRNGAETNDLTPRIDWVPWRDARSYAFILQRSGKTILLRYPKRSDYQVLRQWSYGGANRSLQHGATYSFYVYAYTAGRPGGFLIGQTTWKIR